MKRYRVFFQPSGRQGEVPEDTTVLEASRLLGAEIESVCGGKKSCGKCLVRLESGTIEHSGMTSLPGHLSPLTEEERKLIGEKKRVDGFRLACAAAIRGDVMVFVPEESQAARQVVRKKASEKKITLNPAVRLFPVTLPPPDAEPSFGRL